MAGTSRKRLSDDMLLTVARHLRDKSRLNVALASTHTFNNLYSDLVRSNLGRSRSLVEGDVLDFEANDGTCALSHAIHYSDVDLFEKCLEVMDFWNQEQRQPNLWRRRMYGLVYQCLFAGSLECLVYLREKSPEGVRRELLSDNPKIASMRMNHFHLADFFSEYNRHENGKQLLQMSFDPKRANKPFRFARVYHWDSPGGFQVRLAKFRKHCKRLAKDRMDGEDRPEPDSDDDDDGEIYLGERERHTDSHDTDGRRGLDIDEEDAERGYYTSDEEDNEEEKRRSLYIRRCTAYVKLVAIQSAQTLRLAYSLMKAHKSACSEEFISKRFWDAVVVKCQYFDSSPSLVEAFIREGKLDVNRVISMELCPVGLSRKKDECPDECDPVDLSLVDIAASNYNATALRVLLRLGANPGGAWSIAGHRGLKTRQSHTSQMMPVVTRALATACHDTAFRDLNRDRHFDRVDGRYELEMQYSYCCGRPYGRCQCRYEEAEQRKRRWEWNHNLQQWMDIRASCDRLANIIRILVGHGAEAGREQRVGNLLGDWHPMIWLIVFAQYTLSRAHDGYREWLYKHQVDGGWEERTLSDELTTKTPATRFDLHPYMRGLGEIYDMLIEADPELKNADELQPHSSKTGLSRLLEVVRWQEPEFPLPPFPARVAKIAEPRWIC
ncbi:hypothetical protein F5Y16DRAFT_391082 [Xylariaceae sp. FL0255]|nr:hypothetical protein F5Y16DRAFT_391082 [Xylariaceae sp. FL0255]